MKERLLRQARREYAPGPRLATLAVAGFFFLIVLPYFLIRQGARLDQRFGWTRLRRHPANRVLGWPLIVTGWLFAIWSVYALFTRGRGTPVPLMATQKLVVQRPYSYCRNPMALGAIGMYLGIALVAGSIGAGLLVLLSAALLLLYIKWGEEREMTARFGQEYLAYKQRTPFLIPRLWARREE